MINIGTKLKCISRVEFIDGTIHCVNDEFTVDEYNIDYFIHFMGENYVIV